MMLAVPACWSSEVSAASRTVALVTVLALRILLLELSPARGNLAVQCPGRGRLPQVEPLIEAAVVQRVEVLHRLLALPQHLVPDLRAGHRARVLGVIPGPAGPAREPGGDDHERDRHRKQRADRRKARVVTTCPDVRTQGVSPSSWLISADSDGSAVVRVA